MQTKQLKREFRYNGVRLADPMPSMTIAQVRDFYSATYPEIVNADIEGPETTGDAQVYTFRRAVGTKGLSSEEVGPMLESGSFLPKRRRNTLPADAVNTPLAQAVSRFGDAFARNDQAARLMPQPEMLPLLP